MNRDSFQSPLAMRQVLRRRMRLRQMFSRLRSAIHDIVNGREHHHLNGPRSLSG